MLQTYLKLARHLLDKLPEINWIDFDKGQIDNEQEYESIITPGLLLDFSRVQWTGTGRGNQLGEGQVIVKLVFTKPVETFTRTKNPLQDYEAFDTLNFALHQTFSAMREVKERRDSVGYFTQHWYIIETIYDLQISYEVPVKTIPKPEPNILSTILNIPQ